MWTASRRFIQSNTRLDGRLGSKAELHHTPKADVQGAGIGEKAARQGAIPDPNLPPAPLGDS